MLRRAASCKQGQSFFSLSFRILENYMIITFVFQSVNPLISVMTTYVFKAYDSCSRLLSAKAAILVF